MIKIILLILLVAINSCTDIDKKEELIIIPQPQKVVQKSNFLKIINISLAFSSNGFANNEVFLMKDEINKILRDSYNSELINSQTPNIKINIERILDFNKIRIENEYIPNFKLEGYCLNIEDDGIVIKAFAEQGVFYGLQTLKQLLITNTNKGSLPIIEIVDYPEMKFRAMMDDISRGPIPNMDYMKYQIRRLSALKYNHLTYYIEHVVKTKSHPEFAPDDALTIDEIKELTAYAKKYHITLIGNFQSFGHFENILSHPKYAHLGERGKLLSPAKEESYKFLADIFAELIPAFDSPMFIVNCDETFDLGKGYSKALVDSLGYAEVYKMHILRLYEIVKSYNKQMVIWGDVILKYPKLLDELPNDIIIGTWDYSEVVDTKELVDPIIDKGYKTIVVPGILNSRRVFPDYNTALKNINFIKKMKGKPNVLGMMLSVWDDGGFAFFNHDWYGVAYGAQAAWNFKEITVESYDRRYSSTILGTDNRNFTDAIHEINKIGKFIPTYLMNDKILKTLSVDEKSSSININLTEWSEVYNISKNVEKLLMNIDKNNSNEEVEVLKFINDLYITLAKEKIGLAKLFPNSNKKPTGTSDELQSAVSEYTKTIISNYEKLSLTLSKLWLMENRNHYLDKMQKLIQTRIENMEPLSRIVEGGVFMVNYYDGKYFVEWLASSPIGVESINEANGNLLIDIGKEESIHPKVASEYKYEGNIYRWKRIYSPMESINKIESKTNSFVEYFYATINSEDIKNVELKISTNARAKVFLNNQIIFNDYEIENYECIKNIKDVKLLKKKNTLMIKLYSTIPSLEFLCKIDGVRIGGRKNKYMVLK